MAKKRIPIQVKLFNKNNEIVQRYQRTVKARILTDVQVGLKNKDIEYGTCRVTYNKDKDYYNEFNFTEFKKFKDTLAVDTELDLIREFI